MDTDGYSVDITKVVYFSIHSGSLKLSLYLVLYQVCSKPFNKNTSVWILLEQGWNGMEK